MSQIEATMLNELATDKHDGETVLAALLKFGEDMDESSRDELVADVRRHNS
jgi:hypothetical protein